MPLLDHFHPPISERRTWEGFHGLWAAALVEKLNHDVLGEDYFADMQVHVGSQVEVDIATLHESQSASAVNTGATATMAAPAWAPPATNLILPTVFPDDIEVQVFTTVTGAHLVGAIELVSPRNKDRPEARQAFVAKCVTYLTRGIGLIVVDIVTNRLANLHNELMGFLGHGEPFLLEPTPTYAVAYRPSRQRTGDQIEVWPRSLTLGQPLPILPLALRNAATIPVDLEEAYGEARERSRLH
jgi:Protein of unknown function (DUF4058)